MSGRYASGLPPAPAREAPPNPRSIWAIWSEIALCAALILLAISLRAQAAGSGMPWEAPLQRILESVEGPVASHDANRLPSRERPEIRRRRRQDRADASAGPGTVDGAVGKIEAGRTETGSSPYL